jgi:hypothetical protein
MLHEDVASALHNVGLAHLRGQNVQQALLSFEAAARIRKGSLGDDHELVAVRCDRNALVLENAEADLDFQFMGFGDFDRYLWSKSESRCCCSVASMKHFGSFAKHCRYESEP